MGNVMAWPWTAWRRPGRGGRALTNSLGNLLQHCDLQRHRKVSTLVGIRN